MGTADYSAAHSQAEVGVVLDDEVLHELVVLGDVRERREEVAVAQRALHDMQRTTHDMQHETYHTTYSSRALHTTVGGYAAHIV